MRRLRVMLVVAMVVGLAGTLGWAQKAPVPVAGYIPQKPLVYAYFQGLAKAGKSFEGTAIAKILDEPEVKEYRRVVGDFIERLMKENMRDAPFGWKDVRKVLDCEIAFALMGVGPPAPDMVLVVRPPDEKVAADLRAIVDRILAKAVPPDAGPIPEEVLDGIAVKRIGPIGLAWIGSDLLLTLGPVTTRGVIQTAKGLQPSLAQDDDFKKACGKALGGRECLIVHWNVEKTLEVAKAGDPDAKAWKIFEGLRTIHLSIAPDRPGMKTSLYIHAPGGPKGILKLLPAKPLDEKTVLARASEDSRSFMAMRFSLEDLFTTIGELAETAGDKEGFDRSMAEADKFLGMDFRKDFLGSLGDEMMVLTVGPGLIILPEFAVTLSVKDEAKCRQGLDKLLAAMEASRRERMGPAQEDRWERRRSLRRGGYSLEKLDYKGRRIDVIKITAAPLPVAPSFALSKGQLIVALVPQTVKKAIDQQDTQFKPISGNSDFAGCRSHLAAKLAMITYCDVKPGFEIAYGGLLTHFAQISNTIPDIGPHSLGTKLPSSNAITPHLFGSVWAMSYDGEGFLFEGYGPAGGLMMPFGNVSGSGIGTIGIQAGFLLPALAKAKESARRASCMNNVRQICLAMIMYAQDHDDKYPDSFGPLLKEGYLSTTKVFVCPSSRTRIPAGFGGDFKNADLAELKKIDELGDYVLVKGVDGNSPADFVFIHDKDGAHRSEGRNCGFVDGHVKWYPERAFQEMMKKQRERMAEMKK